VRDRSVMAHIDFPAKLNPSIGQNCFVVAGLRDDLSVQDLLKGVTPFFIADAVTIAGLEAFPQIVLWLPSQV